MRQAILAACALPFTLAAAAADLDTILDLNHAAHGGEAYTRLESIRVELLITAPGYEVRGTYLARRDGLARMDIHAGGRRVFAEALGPECAWSWHLNQPAEARGGCVDDREAAHLVHGLELPGLFHTLRDVRDRGAKVQLLGAVGTESGPEWQLRVLLEDGFTLDYFIEQASHRITRAREFRALDPATDTTEVLIETRFEDPDWIEGVLRFGRQVNVNVNTGETVGTTRVLGLALNPELSVERFKAEAP